MAVNYLTSRSILHLVVEHVACRHTLVAGINELKITNTARQCGKDEQHDKAKHRAAGVYIVVSHSYLMIIFSMNSFTMYQMSTEDAAQLMIRRSRV